MFISHTNTKSISKWSTLHYFVGGRKYAITEQFLNPSRLPHTSLRLTGEVRTRLWLNIPREFK